VSTEAAVLRLSLYTLALAFGPMLNAPISEHFGRLPVYILSYGLSLPFLAGSALAPNLGGFLATRFFCGLFQSVTIANLGGTIADLYDARSTGYPMSIFLWAATAGSSTGYFLFAFVAQYRPWYDVFYALLGVSGGFWLIMSGLISIAGETRHSVLLRRRATRLRAETGDTSIDVPMENRRKSWKELLLTTQTRPFRFLFTEAIIFFGLCTTDTCTASVSCSTAPSCSCPAHGATASTLYTWACASWESPAASPSALSPTSSRDDGTDAASAARTAPTSRRPACS